MKQHPMIGYIKSLDETDSLLSKVYTKIRSKVQYPQLYLQELRQSQFTKETQEEWKSVEKQCFLILCYHANIVDDAMDYIEEGLDEEDAKSVEEKL